jgi:hypothetical protein
MYDKIFLDVALRLYFITELNGRHLIIIVDYIRSIGNYTIALKKEILLNMVIKILWHKDMLQ